MFAIMLGKDVYIALAAGVLFLRILFILWVVFGALLTRSRPWLRWFHIASLVWGIFTETLRWPCLLTIAEDTGSKAGLELGHTKEDSCFIIWMLLYTRTYQAPYS
jgi:hypothetical protein